MQLDQGQVIKEMAGRMADVTVDMNRSYGTVTIDIVGGESIFLQGDEADNFIAEVDRIYDEAQNVTEDECALCVASPYAESVL
jgi:hypothetical protein